MNVSDFFAGGTALRIALFGIGIVYCFRHRRAVSLVTLCHVGSIAVLVLLIFSREWATIVGIPVTALVVERLTHLVQLESQPPELR